MKFDSLVPGMTVYDVGRHKMGNTTLSTVAVWSVRIISIDTVRQVVTASWNGNAPREFRGRSIGKWRKNEPLVILSHGGAMARLATRAEIAAHKASKDQA